MRFAGIAQVTLLMFVSLYAQDSKPQPADKPIKNWEYRKFEQGQLVGIFKGEEARLVGDGEYDLELPSGLLYTKPENPQEKSQKIFLRAKKGCYNQPKNIFILTKEGVIEFEDGLVISSEELVLEVTKKLFSTSKPVNIKKGNTLIEGTGLVADQNLETVNIMERVRLKSRVGDKERECIGDKACIHFHQIQGERKIKEVEAYGNIKLQDENSNVVFADKLFRSDNLGMTRLESKGFCSLTKEKMKFEAPYIVLLEMPDRIILKGPKVICIREDSGQINLTCANDAIFNSKGSIVLQGEARIIDKELSISSDKIVIRFDEKQKTVEEVWGFSCVKVINKKEGATVYCDILKRSITTGIVQMEGKPYAILEKSDCILNAGTLIFDEKKGIVNGKKGEKRSNVLLKPPTQE
jgi:LPS export ABC transporter protein LptC